MQNLLGKIYLPLSQEYWFVLSGIPFKKNCYEIVETLHDLSTFRMGEHDVPEEYILY